MAREVSGCVTDGTLAGPLPGLTVRLSVDGALVAEGITDLEGCYRLPWAQPPAGLSAGSPTAAGIATSRVRVDVLDDRQHQLGQSADSLELAEGEELEVDLAIPAQSLQQADGELRFINGEPVDLAAAARLSVRGLRDAYSFLRHPNREARNIDLIQRAFPNTRSRWAEPPFAFGECAETWGDAMRRLLAERGAPMGEHEADDLPQGAPIRTFHGERVSVRFTTDDAYPDDRVDASPPISDEEVMLPSGVSIGWIRHRLADVNAENTQVAPAYVQRVAVLCDYFLGALTRAPFSLRDPRGVRVGSTRMDVRIFHQHPFAATTHPSLDHIQVAPSNSNEVNGRVLPCVLFLRCAYMYNDTSRVRGLRDLVRHGGASLVSDMLGGRGADAGVDPNQALPLASSLLDDEHGPKKAARFARRMWRYFARQHGLDAPDEDLGTAGGFDFFRKMLVASADPDLRYEAEALRSARSGLPWWGTFDRFVGQGADAAPGTSFETSWGNWLVADVIDGLGIESEDRRFQLSRRDRSGGRGAQRHPDRGILGANGDMRLRAGGRTKRHVTGLTPWSSRVFRIRPRSGESAGAISVRLECHARLADVLVQVLRVGVDGSLAEVHRSQALDLTKVVAFDGLDSVIVIVATRDLGGDFTLLFGEHASLSDVMITPANARAGTETCVDPSGWAWSWLSPDIMVDNDDDGRSDGLLPTGMDNKLKVRLRNRGNVRSGPVMVRFWYQSATLGPSAEGWMPVRDASGERQELQSLRLDPDEFRWFAVQWAPADDGSGEAGFRVRVELTELHRTGPGQSPLNTDNKASSTVIRRVRPLNDPDFMDITVRSVNSGTGCGVCPVPHGPDWTAEKEQGEAEVDPHFGLSRVRFRLTRRGDRDPLAVGVKEPAPTPAHYYPVDARTLPPGISGSDLITLVAEAPGEALSGVTFEVVTDNTPVADVGGAPGTGSATLLS
ncbi:MAG: hypothetical protein ACI8Y8_003817 [Planctomycetota bacterium]